MSLADFSKGIIRRRIMLRLNRVKSTRSIELAIWYLSRMPGGVLSTRKESVPRLRRKVKEVYQQIYTVDPFTLLILGMVIKIVAKLVIEWWLSRRDVEELQSMQSECTGLQYLLAQRGIT